MKNFLKRLLSQDIVRVLSIPQFLYFTLSVIFSQMAINMMNIVLIFLIFFLTNSNFSVSMLVLTFLVPQVVLSFVGGIVADLFNRRKVLYVSNLLRGVILLVLFFDSHSRFLVYIIALATSVVTQFYVPAEAPIIPNLVKEKYLIAANSVFGICLFGSILVGYIIAGPSIQYLGRSGVFLFLGGLFALASIFSFMIPIEAAKPEATHDGPVSIEIRKSLGEEIHSMYMLLRYTKKAGSAFFLLIFSQVVIWVLATIVPGYARHILDVPAEDLSVLLFAPAAFGMIVSSLLIGSKFSKTNENKLMNVGIFLSALSLVLFPAITIISRSSIVRGINHFLPGAFDINIVTLMLLVALAAGCANALISIPSQAVIQTVIPESSRSKIYGLLFALIGAFSLIPIILAGGIADIFGVGLVLIIMGIIIFGIGLSRIRIFAILKGVGHD